MPTETLYKEYQKKVTPLINTFDLSGTAKSFKHLIQVAEVFTDKESVKNSVKLLQALNKVKAELPIDKLNVPHSEKLFEIVNKNIQTLDKMFSDFKLICKGCEIIMDDNATEQMENFKKCHFVLLYISDYLKLGLDVDKAKKATKKIYTLNELLATTGIT